MLHQKSAENQAVAGTLRRPVRPAAAVREYSRTMNGSQPTKIDLVATAQYRESYANSVQVRVNLWDFFLTFGTITQTTPENVSIQNFQGVYMSPQQAKALSNLLQQNVTQYEAAFGEINLEPRQAGGVIQ